MREVCGLDGAAYAPAGNAEGFAAAIVALINDRTRREMMGRNARVIAREIFGLPKIAAAYERVVFPREGRAGP
jgi:glycosyltransferase involved in cell wall biosynthesis